MIPVHIPPGKVEEFNKLKAEFDELGEKIGALTDQYRDRVPPPDVSAVIRGMSQRQMVIMSSIRGLSGQ
jgi:hypothetical protein